MEFDFKRQFEERGDARCLVAGETSVSYRQFSALIAKWEAELDRRACHAAQVVAVCGDFSSDVCALIFALAGRAAIIVPLSSTSAATHPEYLDIAQVEAVFTVEADASWRFTSRSVSAGRHALFAQLEREQAAGLILFSSGSTGQSKASLLNFEKIAARSQQKSTRAYTTLAFLLLDHIGGINTLLHTLGSGGCIVTPASRTPDDVCAAIARERVQLLPTSPTFLNMLLISEAYHRHDLASLELITYGTEPMPANTLAALRATLPDVKLKQTYGLSELGIMPTRSKSSDSLWMKLGDAGFEHKIVDGLLWIRSDCAMSGYLNAASPFDADGWFNTQDMVETEDGYLKVLGRRSEIINVGGEKVYPNEVENTLLAAANVRDVTVSGKSNAITGQVVIARVSLIDDEDHGAAVARLRHFCEARLERHKVPVRIDISDAEHHGSRFKKARCAAPDGVAP